MKKMILIVLTLFITGILSGCRMSEEDAKAYVQASLDAAYKAEFDAFVEITDSTPEGAKAMYEENIDYILENTLLSEANLNDELVEKYKQFYIDLIRIAEYSVGEAVKNEDDSFTVEVIVRPLNIFKDIEEELAKIATERLLENMDKYSSDEEIEIMVYEELYDIINARLEEPVYAEENIIIKVDLHKNSEGMYVIDEADMNALDNALFAVE